MDTKKREDKKDRKERERKIIISVDKNSVDKNQDDVKMTSLPSKVGRNEHEFRAILPM